MVPPIVTLSGGGATTQATATATVVNGVVTGIRHQYARSGLHLGPDRHHRREPDPSHPLCVGQQRRIPDARRRPVMGPLPEQFRRSSRRRHAAAAICPNARVTNLDLAIGAVDPTTGANITRAGDSNLLLATTDGRGSFAIRLAPLVIPNTPQQPKNLGLHQGDYGAADSNNVEYTQLANPSVDGYTEQSALGVGVVYVSLYDMSDPNRPVLIGGLDTSTFDPNNLPDRDRGQ